MLEAHEYPKSIFGIIMRKIVYPVYPSFSYIKVKFNGVYNCTLHGHVFLMGTENKTVVVNTINDFFS